MLWSRVGMVCWLLVIVYVLRTICNGSHLHMGYTSYSPFINSTVSGKSEQFW